MGTMSNSSGLFCEVSSGSKNISMYRRYRGLLPSSYSTVGKVKLSVLGLEKLPKCLEPFSPAQEWNPSLNAP